LLLNQVRSIYHAIWFCQNNSLILASLVWYGVCKYVCIHVFMYVCMHVCTHARMCAYAYLCEQAQAKIFSATIRWERIGATPQMLRNLCDPGFCQTDPCQTTADGKQCFMNAPNCIDFNFDQDAGCTTYDHRTILYTVDAVFHDTAFADIFNLPRVGSKAMTDPPTEFCLDQVCEAVQLSILAHTETNVLKKTQKLIYVRYQRIVSYPAQAPIWKASASFMTVGTLKRFPQCLSQVSPSAQQKTECVENFPCAVCLAPQLGAVIQDCKECLTDFADSHLKVSTTVHFADFCLHASTAMCASGCRTNGYAACHMGFTARAFL